MRRILFTHDIVMHNTYICDCVSSVFGVLFEQWFECAERRLLKAAMVSPCNIVDIAVVHILLNIMLIAN